MQATDDLLHTPEQDPKQARDLRDAYLARKAKNGDLQARNTLVTEHLYLVDRQLRNFTGKGVPTDVLYQEGCYGLILAVDRFNPDHKAALDTYATYYINKHLWLALVENHAHPISLKSKSARWCKRYKEISEQLNNQLGRTPSTQEFADALGIAYSSAVSILYACTNAVSYDEIEEHVSSDYSGRGAEAEALERLNEMNLDAFQVTLNPTEEEILFLYFGFGPNGAPHTFIEIGSILHISPDTVAKYYRIAIEKLRNAEKTF